MFIAILTETRGDNEQFWEKWLEEKLGFIDEPRQPLHRLVPQKFKIPGASEGHMFASPKEYVQHIHVVVDDTV